MESHASEYLLIQAGLSELVEDSDLYEYLYEKHESEMPIGTIMGDTDLPVDWLWYKVFADDDDYRIWFKKTRRRAASVRLDCKNCNTKLENELYLVYGKLNPDGDQYLLCALCSKCAGGKE